MKKRLFSLLLALIMILSLSACSSEGEEITEKPTESDEAPAHTHTDEELESDPAPDFTVYNKEGNSVKLSDMKGTPVVLNFWASWCPPCKAEMPDFEEMYKKYGDEVTFMMVNMTDGDRETVELAKKHVEDNGFTFPVYFDTEMSAAYAYYVTSLPATYFIDAEGNLITHAIGMINAATLERGIEFIK